MKRLDRDLANIEWIKKFSRATIYHLPFLSSDRRSLLPDENLGNTRILTHWI